MYYYILLNFFYWLSNGEIQDGTQDNRNHSKSSQNSLDLKWLIQNGSHFGQFSNGQATGFQVLFEIQTTCKLTSFQPFQIQTCPGFRSPLYLKRID